MTIPEEEREGQGSNEPTGEQCLLVATGCLYKLAAEKACHRWSFMLEGDRTGRSISEFKNYNYLTVNNGLHDVVKKGARWIFPMSRKDKSLKTCIKQYISQQFRV